MMKTINLKNAVESTTSADYADCSRDCDNFLLHRMGDTLSEKNCHNLLNNQRINHSHYDSTAFFRIKKFTSVSLIIFLGLLSTHLEAAKYKKKNTEDVQAATAKEEARFPIGCRPVGYKQNLKILSLFPGKEGALQSLYFFYNKLSQPISLYQMRDEDSEYTTRVNHTIGGHQWAALATGEPLVKFICTLGDGKTSYGKIVDCADTIKVCEYVNVKFGLNNKGNFWVVDGTTRNGAVNGVVYYGIIPGV